jgi:hypothetical protein
MKARNLMSLVMLLCALTTSAAACGSSGSSSSSTPTSGASSTATAPATSSASPSLSGGAAAAEITADWTAFFDAKTPVARRVSLLQDGQIFAPIIQAQANSTLASTASARVKNVTVTSPTRAKVTYDILVAGSPALPNQSGVAVLQGGTWKVGLASFCSLLTLEKQFGLSSTVPAACKAAG